MPPAEVARAAPDFGVYVHVPFCAVRCGYCDFNTYTATELGGGGSQAAYAGNAIAEVELAAHLLAAEPAGVPTARTVFFGGGTPTLLPAADLTRILGAIADRLGLAPDAEVTTEANPDSVTPESLAELRAGGFNRISFGMQSAVPHVLAVLDRTHDPARVPEAVRWAREAGFEQVSLDLIYGTAGESLEDWRTSLEAALECEPDHVSAYSLIVEDGTRLARQIRTGLVAAPDDDDLADKYLLADELLEKAGFGWYEVSNWARTPEARCRHNELYWTSANWWGIGPGAHSHLSGRRWWNLKHPSAYAARVGHGESPAENGELVDEDARRLERVLLEIRMRDGLPIAILPDRSRVDGIVDRGLATFTAGPTGDRLVLTRDGRLLADGVVRELLD
ncbi:MAG TPA: radical SAM family heme chaperone HemW [Marmoricola sp.]|nr:radical SAM family heme chaperone HemW [Marmoricola sp.]